MVCNSLNLSKVPSRSNVRSLEREGDMFVFDVKYYFESRSSSVVLSIKWFGPNLSLERKAILQDEDRLV